MRFKRWAVLALVVAIALGVTGCEGLSRSQVQDVLHTVGRTPGVLRETHVDVSPAGYCQQVCSQGSATLVVSPKLSERSVLAIRDEVAGALTAGHIDGFELMLTLQQGPDRITLDATHAQYAAFWKLRSLAGMQKVAMQASPWILDVSNRATIDVTADRQANVIPILKSSANAITSSGVFGKRIFLTSRSADGRYWFALNPRVTPLPYLALDERILADPALTGGSVDNSLLARVGLVGLRVRSLSSVPDEYLRYDTILINYPALYVHSIDYPDGSVSVYGHLVATDPAMMALTEGIATGAHLSLIAIEQDPARGNTIAFDVPTDADAALLNAVYLAHPELHALSDFRVTSHEGNGGPSVWISGIAAN
jgi:hypothetical protein